jgi:homoserine/homoserine lactone efflux protein
MAGYTALAAKVLTALKEVSHVRAMNRVFGTFFVLAGTLLALFKRST